MTLSASVQIPVIDPQDNQNVVTIQVNLDTGTITLAGGYKMTPSLFTAITPVLNAFFTGYPTVQGQLQGIATEIGNAIGIPVKLSTI